LLGFALASGGLYALACLLRFLLSFDIFLDAGAALATSLFPLEFFGSESHEEIIILPFLQLTHRQEVLNTAKKVENIRFRHKIF